MICALNSSANPTLHPLRPPDRSIHPIGANALRYRFEKNMLTRYRIVTLWVHCRLIRRTAGLFSEPYRAYRESRFFICVFKIIEITDSKGASFSKSCCCCDYSTARGLSGWSGGTMDWLQAHVSNLYNIIINYTKIRYNLLLIIRRINAWNK